MNIRDGTSQVSQNPRDLGHPGFYLSQFKPLKVQSEHFKIEGLEDAIQVCYRDFVGVWSPDSPLLKD